MANSRKPDNVHRLNRTYKPGRHGDPKTKVQLESRAPICPKWLNGKARGEWRRICRILGPTGVLALTDRTILIQYCLLFAQLRENPASFTAADHTQLRLIQQEIGLTPISRSKLVAPKKAGEFEEF